MLPGRAIDSLDFASLDFASLDFALPDFGQPLSEGPKYRSSVGVQPRAPRRTSRASGHDRDVIDDLVLEGREYALTAYVSFRTI